MTQTTGPVTLLRQPVIERIDSVEQAVRSFALDPSLDSREGAYCFGFIEAGTAGLIYAMSQTLPSEFTDMLTEAYSSPLAPLPFAAALSATCRWSLWREPGSMRFSAKALRQVGRMAGWRAATENAPGATDCPVCARRLIDGFDGDVHRCRVDGVLLCSSDTRDCWAGFCGNTPTHHRECFDAVSI